MPGIAGNYSGGNFSYPLANVIKIAVDLSNGVQAAIKTQQIIILYLCGMGVVLASSMVMVYQIVRYQPKKILDDGVKKENKSDKITEYAELTVFF